MQTHHRCQYHTVCVAVLQGLKRAENATVLSGYLVVSSECGLVPLCCTAWLQKVAKGGLTPHGAARISDSDRVSDRDSLATLKVLALRSLTVARCARHPHRFRGRLRGSFGEIVVKP